MPADLLTTQMQAIFAKWGTTIGFACSNVTPPIIPTEFLAALVANESGGNPDAKRFERGVLGSLWNVLLAREAHYGSIGQQDVRGYLVRGVSVTDANTNADDYLDRSMQRLDSLATSWGLTQIMGYHVLGEDFPYASVDDLRDGEKNLVAAVWLLKAFARQWPATEISDSEVLANRLFHCWNTGSPTGATFDKNYVPNGLTRMRIYKGLLTGTSVVDNPTVTT